MVNILQKFPLFASMDAACLQSLEQSGQHCHFTAGQALYHEGQKASGVHIVLSGFVKVIRITSQGKELVLFLARPGSILGEGAVFQGAQTLYSQATEVATAMATKAVQTLFIPQESMFVLLQEHTSLPLCMLKTLATRQRMFMHKLAAQAERGAVRRVAAYLCHRLVIEGTEQQDEKSLVLGISREDLANLLGLARETVSRQLSVLIEKGAINIQGRTLHICDYALLKKLSQEG